MTAAATSFRPNLRLLPDWLTGAFCLAIPALYNSFPLITSDSGAYIGNGYALQIPLDRPIAYSVLVRLSSLGITLWGVVAVQAMIVSALLLALARYFLGAAYSLRSFAAIMLMLGAATSAGWFTGQIMPDIYTAVMLLVCLAICLIHINRSVHFFLCLLLLGCMLVHNSNLLIALLTGIILYIYCLRRKHPALRRTAIALLASSAAAWLILSAMTAIAGRGFRPSTASHVFLMSRMVENGIMDDFLDDYCPTDSAAYKLCAYRNKLPVRQWDFMWDISGPLYETGGWQANEGEFNRIIRKTLLNPRYLFLHGVKATHATLRQLPLVYVGDGLMRFDHASSPTREIHKYFKGEEKEFLAAEQQNRGLHLEWWNPLIIVFALGSMIAALLVPARRAPRNSSSFRTALRFTLLFLLINAAVTATLATVIGRYESRVVWVLPFLSILYIMCSMQHRNRIAAPID